MIRGNVVDEVRMRQYSALSKTVEYLSLEPLSDSRALSASVAAGSGSGEESSRRVETLGETATLRSSWDIAPPTHYEVCPIVYRKSTVTAFGR